jgi:predicted TPR repeat methyltransferase
VTSLRSARSRLRDAANLGEKALQACTAAALEDSETVLDVGCGTESILERLPRRAHTTGLDGHLPAIEHSRARGIHDDYVQADATRRLELADDTYDAVIAFDLIEHLIKPDGLRLLADAERIARRVVVVFTPNGAVEQDEYDGNPLQVHRSAWSLADFRKAGFTVLGMKGYRRLRGPHSTPRRPQTLSRIVLSLSQPVVQRRPEHAYALLAIKRVAR